MKGLVMQLGLNNGSLTKLNQSSGIGNVQGSLKKDGIEKNLQTCAVSSVFNQIPENVIQEENKQEVDSSEQENAKEKTVSIDIDIDSMIEGMLGDFVDSIKGAIEDAIRDKIQETIQDIVEDVVTNGVNGAKETENTDASKEGGVNDGKNNKAVFGDPNQPDWRNSKEARDKIAAEEKAKFTDSSDRFCWEMPAKLRDAQEADVDGIIGIHSEEDIKGVSGADLYELYENFKESYGARDMNDIKNSAALVKILQYASKEQLQEFAQALKEKHPNNSVFSRLARGNDNHGVTSQEWNRLLKKLNEFSEYELHQYFNLSTCGGGAVFFA